MKSIYLDKQSVLGLCQFAFKDIQPILMCQLLFWQSIKDRTRLQIILTCPESSIGFYLTSLANPIEILNGIYK